MKFSALVAKADGISAYGKPFAPGSIPSGRGVPVTVDGKVVGHAVLTVQTNGDVLAQFEVPDTAQLDGRFPALGGTTDIVNGRIVHMTPREVSANVGPNADARIPALRVTGSQS